MTTETNEFVSPSPFEIGQRVVLVSQYTMTPHSIPKRELLVGMMGVVKAFTDKRVGVEWDEYINGHSLARRDRGEAAKSGHGWFVHPYNIQLAEDIYDN